LRGCLRERLVNNLFGTHFMTGQSYPVSGFRIRSGSFVTGLARAVYQNNSTDWENKPIGLFWWDWLSLRTAVFLGRLS